MAATTEVPAIILLAHQASLCLGFSTGESLKCRRSASLLAPPRSRFATISPHSPLIFASRRRALFARFNLWPREFV